MVLYVTDKLGQRRLSLRSLSYPPGETYALATTRVSRDNTSYDTTYLNCLIASDTSLWSVWRWRLMCCAVIVLKRNVSTGYGIPVFNLSAPASISEYCWAVATVTWLPCRFGHVTVGHVVRVAHVRAVRRVSRDSPSLWDRSRDSVNIRNRDVPQMKLPIRFHNITEYKIYTRFHSITDRCARSTNACGIHQDQYEWSNQTCIVLLVEIQPRFMYRVCDGYA